MFGWRFLDDGSTDSESVDSFGNCDSRINLCCNRYFCTLTKKKGGSTGPAVVCALRRYGWLRCSRHMPTSMHYINWCRIVSRSQGPCESMYGHAWTLSEQVIASFIDDSRCGMSDVAFRTAPLISGLSCLAFLLLHAATNIKGWIKTITGVNEKMQIFCH